MGYEEFISGVADEAQIGFIDADIATEAFLENLGHRLPAAKMRELADQLPAELAEYLSQGQFIDLKLATGGFFEQVGRAEDREMSMATDHARAVWHVLAQAISEHELEQVASRLPGDVTAQLI